MTLDLQEELRKFVDELKSDAKQVSKLVSDTVRVVNFGLAAMLIVIRSGQLGPVKLSDAGLTLVFCASAFGAMGIVFDVLQNITSLHHSRNKLLKVQELQKAGVQIESRDHFMTLETDRLPRLRAFLFYAKIAFSGIGSLLLALSIFEG